MISLNWEIYVKGTFDVRWWIPEGLPFPTDVADEPQTMSKNQYKKIIAIPISKSFPKGFVLLIRSKLTQGSRVAVEVESYAIQVGTGKCYNNKYVFLIELQNNKIKRVKEYMNTLHLMNVLNPQVSQTEEQKKICVDFFHSQTTK